MKLDAERLNSAWQALCGLRHWLAPVDDAPLCGVSPEVWARLVGARDGGAPTLAEAVKRIAGEAADDASVLVELGRLFGAAHGPLSGVLAPLTYLGVRANPTEVSPGEADGRPRLKRSMTAGERGAFWGTPQADKLVKDVIGSFYNGYLPYVKTKSDSGRRVGPKLEARISGTSLELTCTANHAPPEVTEAGPHIASWDVTALDSTARPDSAFADFAGKIALMFRQFESLPNEEAAPSGSPHEHVAEHRRPRL